MYNQLHVFIYKTVCVIRVCTYVHVPPQDSKETVSSVSKQIRSGEKCQFLGELTCKAIELGSLHVCTEKRLLTNVQWEFECCITYYTTYSEVFVEGIGSNSLTTASGTITNH